MPFQNSSLPLLTNTYSDEGLAVEVVDVIKLYPEILNNSNWRDATYQAFEACNRFHPYVFDLINEWQKSPFGACTYAVAIDMTDRYDEVKWVGEFNGMANLVYDLINEWQKSPFGACTYAVAIDMTDRYDEVKWVGEFNGMANLVYGYLAPLFGTIGLIFALLTLVLIRRQPALHIPYGIIVFFQCLLLVFLLIEYSTVEMAYIVQIAPSMDLTNQTMENYTYGIFINNTRIDRFMVFVNFSLSMAIAFLRLYKSFNRFCALYFAASFEHIFTVPFTKKICFVITIISLLVFMPLVALPDVCKVEITALGIMPYSTCSTVLTSSYTILRIAIAICGFVLGILTVIKFRKYLKMNTWSTVRTKQERSLIIQTFCDLIDFVAVSIPLILFRLIWASPYLVSRCLPYLYIMNLMSHRSVTMACFGHSIDGMISLFLLKKIVKLEGQIEPVSLFSSR